MLFNLVWVLSTLGFSRIWRTQTFVAYNLEIECDAIVSPGNSFGFMDGGVDLSISKHFGWGIQKELRSQISELPMKELLVGQALCIPTNRERIKYVICTPTMRIPTSQSIGDSVNAYLATKAALELANKNSEIQCLAFTGPMHRNR